MASGLLLGSAGNRLVNVGQSCEFGPSSPFDGQALRNHEVRFSSD